MTILYLTFSMCGFPPNCELVISLSAMKDFPKGGRIVFLSEPPAPLTRHYKCSLYMFYL